MTTTIAILCIVCLACILCILCAVCAVQAIYLRHIGKQLAEWLEYLKSVRTAPNQKNFIKSKGVVAEINYEMNAILEENRKQLIKLTKAEAANQQILTNLSHDVRTPLASLLGYLEALEQGRAKIGEQDKQKEYTQIAYRKALDLKELVDILFDWFKISSNEQEYHFKEYDVNELTRQLIIGYIPLMERENVHLEAQISEEEWFLRMDKLAYERIIDNLFGNALKHGKCSHLAMKTQRNEDTVIIEISNDGVTIPKEEMQHIFERSYQGDASCSQNGNGLGLAIAKELAAAMQGNITAQSVQGKTSFYLTFPLYVRKK